MILKVGQNLMKLLAMFAFVVFDLFFSVYTIGQEIGWEERLRNDLGLFSVGWDVKP